MKCAELRLARAESRHDHYSAVTSAETTLKPLLADICAAEHEVEEIKRKVAAVKSGARLDPLALGIGSAAA